MTKGGALIFGTIAGTTLLGAGSGVALAESLNNAPIEHVQDVQDQLNHDVIALEDGVASMSACSQAVINTTVEVSDLQKQRTDRYIPRITAEDTQTIIIELCGEQAEADTYVELRGAVSTSEASLSRAEDQASLDGEEAVAGIALGSTSGWAVGVVLAYIGYSRHLRKNREQNRL